VERNEDKMRKFVLMCHQFPNENRILMNCMPQCENLARAVVITVSLIDVKRAADL
jgi:hypothetical protein